MQHTTSYENHYSSTRDSPSKWIGDDDKGYVYKKSSYQFSGSGNNKPLGENVDQLDALLEDLKTERQITRDRDNLSSAMNYRVIERERPDQAGTITKTTRVIKTSKNTGVSPVIDDVVNLSTSDFSTLKSNGYSSYHDTLNADDYQTKEKIYGGRNVYESKSKLYESNRALENIVLDPSTDISTTTHLEKDLQKIALSDDILPIPGTKVTTTVRTYTYEIPAGTPTSTINRSQLHNNVNYSTIQMNEINNAIQPNPRPVPTVPQTVVYNTESYSTTNNNNDRPLVSNQSYEIREHRETNSIRKNLSPHPHNLPDNFGETSKTIGYNINTIENTRTMHEPSHYPVQNTHSPIRGPNSPQHDNTPIGPNTTKYYYKKSSNVVNTIHEPGMPSEPNMNLNHQSPQKMSPSSYSPHDTGYPPHGPSTIYKYSSSTMNTRRGPEYETPSPTLHTAPFPVDGVDYPMTKGNAPQRIDDLMQSFGNTDSVDRYESNAPYRKREVETAVATPNQQNIPSINKAGKEVYYPPGHEIMVTKREEMHAGSAAGGRWAKGSGMYEYESGSKSKTTTKSGGAMVPVCLPLCCAMPCSIM